MCDTYLLKRYICLREFVLNYYKYFDTLNFVFNFNSIFHQIVKMTQAKLQNKKEHKNSWTKEQDEYIRNLVDPNDWNSIAEKANLLFPKSEKTPQEYNKRWQSLTDDIENRDPWSTREEVCVLIAHNLYKNKWSEMGSMLKGRSNNTIKNKFYSIFRRIKGKIQKSDYSYNNKLELLETYYIISIIEQYLANPSQCSRSKGKRGKDYIYSLIHNITYTEVMDYKEKINLLAKNEGSMKDLFDELSIEHKIDIVKQTKETKSQEQIIEEVKLPILDKNTINQEEDINMEIIEDSNKSDDIFNTQFKMPEQEQPLFSETDFAIPVPLFSPPTLSAGAAAAAERGIKAPCFNEGSFADVSSMTKEMMYEENIPQNNCIIDLQKWGYTEYQENQYL